MQLEIKIVIDFGDDGPPKDDMNEIFRSVVARLQQRVLDPMRYTYGAHGQATLGWTSSGDDEE